MADEQIVDYIKKLLTDPDERVAYLEGPKRAVRAAGLNSVQRRIMLSQGVQDLVDQLEEENPGGGYRLP